MAFVQAAAFASTPQNAPEHQARARGSPWSVGSLAAAAPSLAVGQAALNAGASCSQLSAGFAMASLALLAAHCHRLAGRRRRMRRTARPSRGGEGASRFQLAEHDQWIAALDLPAFGKDVHELGQQLKAEQGEADQEHLCKMITWSKTFAFAGLATMWLAPNPLTIVALSLWTHSAWTMIGHHVCHGGYNRTDPSGHYSSRGFAIGSLARRVTDWFDWMLPEAWNVEHNQLHHYRLGENSDPDLVERNVSNWTGVERFLNPVIYMCMWKWAYYAPNTYKELKIAEIRRKGKSLPEGFDPQAPMTLFDCFEGKAAGLFSISELLMRVIGPYFLCHFLLMPLPLALINPAFYMNAVINLFLSDIVSNIHGFVVIVTNHAGEDLYRFERGCKPKSPTFYLRAITSSANFNTGGDVNDFMHGWLNYQIEHHCWPELSMLAYRKGQPKLKAICAKYGVPYVQEDVFTRLAKTMSIGWQFTTMRKYPLAYERPEDEMVWGEEKAEYERPKHEMISNGERA